MTAATASTTRRPPFWRNVRVLRVVVQAVFVAAVAGLVLFLLDNVVYNLERRGIPTGFDYLRQPAGFAIPDSDFRSTQSLGDALLVGVQNTIKVALLGIVLATVLGVLIGVARLSTNWLVRKAAAVYVETFRNIPVLVIILFWYLGVMIRLPPIREAVEALDLVAVSNRGIVIPWFDQVGAGAAFGVVALVAVAAAAGVWAWRTRRFDRTGEPHRRGLWAGAVLLAVLATGFVATGRPWTLDTPEVGELSTSGGFRLAPEYAALLVALSLYTASHIAEIVRGSILAVARGQSEAANALGLSGFQRMRFVVLPQAFRISVPPISNQYLNLVKNSSLGVAISYYEVTKVTQVSIAQSAPAVQAIALLMLIYLAFSLTIAAVTNVVNRRLTLKGRA
ncbi:MAG TPA: ABC transporter permease subunit [Gaiellaceae bacterium]|nr:ABC transporter permease subunit [Gaiellaceae bacterium]